MGKFIDIKGQRFAKLVAVEYIKGSRWKCICDCGNETVTMTNKLTSGHTKSCGCLVGFVSSEVNTTHGLSKSNIYRCWANMKRRCQWPKHRFWHRYGGRGIKVHDPWNDFETFLSDMSDSYFIGASLERVDVDGDYCPENCKWIKRNKQPRNRGNVTMYQFDGKMMTLSEIAAAIGMKEPTLRFRLKNMGWDLDKAVNTPVMSASEARKYRRS